VEVDMTNQHLYLYQNGTVELESDFVSGNMSKGYNTPAGVFGLTYKTKNAVLRGADYATPVNYWMPFNGNVGMHDATWRSSFGGNIYLTSGSHGCINLPLDKAKEIYQYMSENFPIICYYYPEGMLEPVSSETPETEQAAEEQSTTEQPTEEQTTTEQSTTEQGSTE
jgi:lipoprotein-anchoring transpeptidase ErfK/SrfK